MRETLIKFPFTKSKMKTKDLFTWSWGAQIGEVTCGGFAPHLSCKRDQIKMRDYMDRRVTPPKRVTSPTWGPPPSCKQALDKSLAKPLTET